MIKKGVLLVHGFGGGPWEVEILRESFEEEGYLVSVPLLPGHDCVPLKDVTGDDWIAAVEAAYLELRQKCRSVLVVGFSMGGLLTARLWNYQPDGLVTINTPIYYWNIKQIAKNIHEEKELAKKYREGIGKYSAEVLIEFQKLLHSTKSMFRMIRCPVLVIQSMDDDAVRPISAGYILGKVKGDKLMVTFPMGGHHLLQADAGPKVCRLVRQFYDEITGEEENIV